VASWVADGELAELALEPGPSPGELRDFVAAVAGEVQAQDVPAPPARERAPVEA